MSFIFHWFGWIWQTQLHDCFQKVRLWILRTRFCAAFFIFFILNIQTLVSSSESLSVFLTAAIALVVSNLFKGHGRLCEAAQEYFLCVLGQLKTPVQNTAPAGTNMQLILITAGVILLLS